MTESDKKRGQEVERMAKKEGKYLTFTLAEEEYGIGILKIKEIIGMMPITSLPQTPECVKGVINLRGKVIPVVDLRLQFGMASIDYTERTCIIVVEAQTSKAIKCWISKECGKDGCPAYENRDHRCWMISGTLCRDEIQGSFHEKMEACRKCTFYQDMQVQNAVFTIGLVVDSVSEVLNIKDRDIENTPTFGAKLNTDYILGMAKMEGDVKILLDIDRVLSTEEAAALEKAA